MRKAILVQSLEYVAGRFKNTWVNRVDLKDRSGWACVRGDLREQYEPGAILVVEETGELIPGIEPAQLYYSTIVTEEDNE